jgi:hypothetical protein
MELVIFPSRLSAAVAPGSEYEPPTVRFHMLLPPAGSRVITGAMLSAIVVLTKEPDTPPTVRVVVVEVEKLLDEVCLTAN